MKFLKKAHKVEAQSQAAKDLVRALYQTVGNKVFMRGIEQLFEEKLGELSPHQEEDVYHLIRALKNG